MKTIAIILAAGASNRCGFDKIFHDLGDAPLIHHTLKPFQNSSKVDEIIIVLNRSNLDQFSDLQTLFPKVNACYEGGDERFYSLSKVIKSLKGEARVIVHNGANPYLKVEDLDKALDQITIHPNLIFGYFSPNSIKRIVDGKVVEYLDRDEIFETQTPQISTLETLKKAIEVAEAKGITPRDEAETLALINEEVYIYECSRENQKVTYASDFETHNPGSESGIKLDPGFDSESLFGVGEDSHRFTQDFDPTKPVVLGGIKLPESHLTFDANSDGDVILHSLCNAILNAVGEPTFDTFATPMCQKGIIDSTKYLEKTLEILDTQYSTYNIQQVRISLEGLRPKISAHHEEIVSHLARILNIEVLNIGLTYTTGEKLTSFGRGEGIRCTTYVILSKS